MPLTPETIAGGQIEFITYPTRTYKVNFDMTPARGMLDGLEAMRQTIFCALTTERFRYAMFSWNYGVEIENKIGRIPDDWIRLHLRQTVSDALIQDDRITDVQNFMYSQNGTSLTMYFEVVTTVGTIESGLSWWGTGLEVDFY